MAFEQGGPPFGLNDVKVAAYTATNSYGTAADVFSVQALNTTLRMVQAELTGDDKITAVASRPIAGQATLRLGGISLAALEIMTGNTATSSIASPNNVKNFRISGAEDMPYFGLIGKALGADSSGQVEVWLPKCKITSDINLVQLEYGTFSINEMTIMMVPDDTYGLVNIIECEATRALSIPPLNTPTS